MSCVICLEEGAGFVCECSAFHVNCFATFLARGDDECLICHSRFDRRLKAAALDVLSTQTSNLFGETSSTSKARKLQLAVAFAEAGQTDVAKLCLRRLVSGSAEPEWIQAVSQVELARILCREHQLMPAALILEELLPKLVCIKKRWSWLEHMEACTILGGCYSRLRRFIDAESCYCS